MLIFVTSQVYCVDPYIVCASMWILGFTYSICPSDLEPLGEMVESVWLSTYRVFRSRHFGEQSGRTIHTQLAYVHMLL